MASTYGNDLRLEEIGDGEQSGTWGATTNTNLELIAEALSFGTEVITTNADTHITTIADGATDPGRSLYLKYTGTLDSTCTITIAPNSISKTWYIENGTSGSQSIIISQGSGANVTIPTGQTKIVYSDGAGSGAAMAEIGTLGVTNLAVTTNATVGGTLGVTGVLTGTSLDISGNVDIDGNLETDALSINSTAVTSTAAELNILDGVTATTAELNIMDGVTATTAELNILDGVTSTTAELNILDGVTSTATEINQLDAITRGSILYGNASGATARLAAGGADTVLTSDGTDLSWAAAGGAFAASTVTITANTTLTTAQNGNLIHVTATNEKIISLPAAATGLFYVFSNETAYSMYIKPNGAQTINGINVSIILAAGADGIISCGTAGTNWSSVGITRNMIVHKATTIYNTLTENDTRLTGTYTPVLGSSMLICVGSATAGSAGTSSSYNYTSGGGGGQSYAEKFIASPDASYAYEICAGGAGDPNSSFDKTTTVAGMTCTRGPDSPYDSWNNGNTAGRAGGTATGGTVNFTGGSGASRVSTSYPGGGGGAATRAGNGGNASNRYGGGTGGNNATSSAVGAAATARDSNTYAITNSTSETYLAGVVGTNSGHNTAGDGAGPKTLVNFGSVNFTIADHERLNSNSVYTYNSNGGSRGANPGGYVAKGNGGYITFVEFI